MKKGKKGTSAAKKSKRQRFEESGRFPVRRVAVSAGVLVVIVAAVVVGVTMYDRSAEVGEAAVVGEGRVDYADAVLDMASLTFQQTESGTIDLSVSELTGKSIGGFVYSRSAPMPAGFDTVEGNGLPVLAYVAPSGRLVVATSLCEPCRSWDFHIEGEDLVCNACFTRWQLDTLEGVEGGCLEYPPAVLTTTVEGDTIHIQQSDLEAWTPRI